MTIWNGNLFKLESTGEPIPNGYKISAELQPQLSESSLEDFTGHGERMATAIIIIVVASLIGSLICEGSLIPVFGIFETVKLISHLPLVTVSM